MVFRLGIAFDFAIWLEPHRALLRVYLLEWLQAVHPDRFSRANLRTLQRLVQ